jgi:hypothetical protein
MYGMNKLRVLHVLRCPPTSAACRWCEAAIRQLYLHGAATFVAGEGHVGHQGPHVTHAGHCALQGGKLACRKGRRCSMDAAECVAVTCMGVLDILPAEGLIAAYMDGVQTGG